MSTVTGNVWVDTGAAVFLPCIGGFFGSYITRKHVKTWYKGLEKPFFTPPNWLFGPMWTMLYLSMGYASYLIFRDGGGLNGAGKDALILYAVQLALNWLWSPIFFGAHRTGLAFVEILCLWASIAGCIYLFYPINAIASYLMAPYLAWVSLATCLNLRIWQLNPDDDGDKYKRV